MRVTVDEREYTLYISGGLWVMHTYDLLSGAWLTTDYDVSSINPFASGDTYDAWR